jgi:hypothetical protein
MTWIPWSNLPRDDARGTEGPLYFMRCVKTRKQGLMCFSAKIATTARLTLTLTAWNSTIPRLHGGRLVTFLK